jgi:predicted DNA-binding protein
VTNTKPTTIRLPDEVLNELDRRARARGKDRATLLRELLQDALQRDTEDEVVASYRAGRLSLSQAASRLGTDVWSLFDILARRGETVSVSLEDWMQSGSSQSA